MMATASDPRLSAPTARLFGLAPAAEAALLLVLYTALTALLFRFWLPTLGTDLIGPPEDNLQEFWNTWYGAIAADPGHFLATRLLRFPEGTPLVYHSFAYPQVAAVALWARLTGASAEALVPAQNLTLLASFPLAAAGAYYVARHFTGSALASLAGGFVFAFNPSHIEHVMHHAHVSQIEFIPYFVLVYLTALRRRSVALVCLAIALYALCALSCWYYLFYCAYFVVFHSLFIAVRERTWPAGWSLAVPVLTLAGVVVLLSPLLVPMVRAALGSASVYQPGGDLYVADVAAYLAFPPFHALGDAARGIYARLGTNEWEGTVYIGIVNLLLVGWLAWSRRELDRRLLAYLLAVSVLFAVLASGDSLHILGHRTVPMPGAVLSRLPFFKNVRTPSRAMVFVYLFLGVAVSYALAQLGRRARGLPARAAVVAASVLLVADFAPAHPLPVTPRVCPAGLAVIRDDPERGFGVLDLPSGTPRGYLAGNVYMFEQTCHGRPIMQGNISRDIPVSLRDQLNVSDLPAQIAQLKAAHVKYVVINRAPMGIALRRRPGDADLDAYATLLPVVYDGPDLSVYRVQ
jgi:hypothetical protein